jgi:hypothetical protein
MVWSPQKQISTDAMTYRTNTGSRIRQAPARVSDGSRYRKLGGRIMLYVTIEGMRQRMLVAGYGRR